ncbi:COMM domain-containing protein [Caenorhabditis elegans]|uniref:COMM domain-containing protein n=1 Tax=Caenorhabditis elegans TaxID=6239 RepID=O62249_CAEEL|nr:COMM domain-containing protein [Caenorhabditis elegans]CAB07616.1 COMM domain-containing protein [Caenorhabditis elegans]|eukprot:NP_499774.1 Uncharacterized protein CELE_F45G2.7 [Caenorhabditis elegans]
MAPTLAEAEKFLRNSKIDKIVLEKLAEILVTTMDDWNLIADQKVAESVWVVLTEAGRSGNLSENLGDGDVAKQLKSVFEKIRLRLQAQLGTIQWKNDELVDYDVTISKNNKSSLHADHTFQRVVLTLKVIPAGKMDVEALVVDFDEAQLNDFIWKLLEAKAMMDRIQKRVESR